MQIDIYGIYNNANGKIYIGQSRQGYLKRFNQHLCPKDNSPLLQRAVKKYGKEAFSCELLDVAYSEEDANEKEKLWIKVLKTYGENGYNLSMGGSFGNFNEETRKRMSESHKGAKNFFFGKRHTEETKEKLSRMKKALVMEKHPRAKRVVCLETGMVYNCVKQAQIETGINAKHIGQVANNKGRKTAGGFKWAWEKRA